eukprot:227355-Chlamydomonas_euryale.AAC.1
MHACTHTRAQVGAVVVGLDKEINYFKIQYALTCLLTIKDCMFIASNTDARGNLIAGGQVGVDTHGRCDVQQLVEEERGHVGRKSGAGGCGHAWTVRCAAAG